MNAETRSVLERLKSSDESDPVKESRSLDFKRIAPTTSRDSRRDFLEDVCGFANAGGGLIVFGVEEKRTAEGWKQATAGDLLGDNLQGVDFEAYRTSLMDLVRSAFDPRFAGVDIGLFPNPNSARPALVYAEIQESIDAPHMVTTLGPWVHFVRLMTSTEKMGADEIRSSFERSFGARERAEGRLMENALRARAFPMPWAAVHGVWMGATPIARGALRFPLSSKEVWNVLQAQSQRRGYPLTEPRYDHLGAFLLQHSSGIPFERIHADGSVEIIQVASRTEEALSHDSLFKALQECGDGLRRVRGDLGIVGSFWLAASVLRVPGLQLGTSSGHRSQGRFQEEFPFFKRETDDDDFPSAHRDAVDFFWQAAGYRLCSYQHRDEH